MNSINSDLEELKELMVKLAMIGQRLDLRSEAAVAHVEQSAAALEGRSRQVSQEVGAAVQDAMGLVERKTADAVNSALQASMGELRQQVQAVAAQAASASNQLQSASNLLRQQQRGWLQRAATASIIGALICAGASTYAVLQSNQIVKRNRIETALLRAYNNADVMLCGGKLCANIETSNERFGDRKQYRPVRDRK